MNLWHVIWEAMNSPIGLILVSAMLALIGKRFVFVQDIATRYSGTIIQTIKALEKFIPDDTPNAGMKRFDMALKQIVAYIEKVEDRDLTNAENVAIAQAISVEHAKLEADGCLSGWQTVAATAAAEKAEGSPTSDVRPQTSAPSVNLNTWIGWMACAGLLVSMCAGCAQDNASQIAGKAAGISAALHESAITYHTTAVAAGVKPADRYAVEKRMDAVLQAVAAVVDSLQADAAVYEAAVAAGSEVDAAAATSRAKLALDALNALATRLSAEMRSQ